MTAKRLFARLEKIEATQGGTRRFVAFDDELDDPAVMAQFSGRAYAVMPRALTIEEWLETYGPAQLTADLDERAIRPSEAKVQELRKPR